MLPKRALFLDRDGVINIEKNYLYREEDFEFIDGIFDLCRHFQKRGFEIVIVTNQSGICRGYYTQEDFEKLTEWMEAEFAKEEIKIAKTYHCPHHPDFTGSCSCRKPEPGMFLQARKELGLDIENSVMVGDKPSDIEAARRAGIKRGYLFDGKRVKKLQDIIAIEENYVGTQ